MPHTSMYITQLDFSGSVSAQWQNHIGTVEMGAGVVNYLPLVTIIPYILGENDTQIDNAVYADNKILLHREYWYNDPNYQNCYVYLTAQAHPTEIYFTVTKGLVDWGWGEGEFIIRAYDETYRSIGEYSSAAIIEDPTFTGAFQVNYEYRDAGTYYDFNGGEFYYPGGTPDLAYLYVSCNAGMKW